MEEATGDTDSECEYVERVEARLLRRSAEEDNGGARRALRNYAAYLRNDAAVRNMRLQHQNNVKTLTIKIQHIQHRLSKLDGEFNPENVLQAAIAAPFVHFDALLFAFAMMGLPAQELRKHLSTTQRERENEISSFERLLQDMIGQCAAPSAEEMSLVRSHMVGRGSSKRNRGRIQVDKSLPRGEQMLMQKRGENSMVTAFFEKHSGKVYSDLRHHDLLDLEILFDHADANQSGFVEDDDFSKFVRRMLCDFSVSQLEVDRIAMLCRLSTADGFSLPLEAFYDAAARLMTLLESKGDEFLLIEEQGNEKFRSRQAQAAQDEQALYLLERGFQKEAHKIQHDKATPPGEVEDLMLQLVLEKERARATWAKTAIVLTPHELDRIRIQQIASKMHKQRSKGDPADIGGGGDDCDAPTKAAAVVPKRASAPRPPAPPTAGGGLRGASAPEQHSRPVSSRPRSASAMLDVFKASLRAALHRAPLVEIRSAQDIPDETMEREFYQLFTVLSKQDDFITADHIHFLLDIFTPCGSDAAEAADFLFEECDKAEALVFDEFVKFGLNLKLRLLAYEDFIALPSDKDRAKAIEERVFSGDDNRQRALRRYEKEFIRAQEAKRSIADMRRKKEAGSKGGPPTPRRYAPHKPGAIEPRACQEETPDWAAQHGQQQPCDDRSADRRTPPTTSLVPVSSGDGNSHHHVHRSGTLTTPRLHSGDASKYRTPRSAGSATARRLLVAPQPLHHGDPGRQLPIMRFSEHEDVQPDIHHHRRQQDDALVGCLKEALLRPR